LRLPKKLYKYLAPERKEILTSGYIRFTPPAEFNDPFDTSPAMGDVITNDQARTMLLQGIQEALPIAYAALSPEERAITPYSIFCRQAASHLETQAMVNLENFVNAANIGAKKAVSEGVRSRLGVLSLAEKPDDLLMWAHYASNHSGYVLEFDTTSPFFDRRKGSKDELRYLRPIAYQSERPSLISSSNGFDNFLVKSDHWAYEKEWRMTLPLEMADHVIVDRDREIHLYNYPREAVTAVILGCRISRCDEDAIREMAAQIKFPVVKAKADERWFKINIPRPSNSTDK
jgi:hypothetical protein